MSQFQRDVKSLPDWVTVNGVVWKLTVKSEPEKGEEACFGETDDEERTIYLYSNTHEKYLRKGQVFSTLFHELIHASLFSTGLHGLLKDDKVEEALAVSLEEGLYPLIQAGLFKKGK